MSERVLVALSGGVDSSVAAALLVGAGDDRVGAPMKLFVLRESVPDRPVCLPDLITPAQPSPHTIR